MSSKQLKKITLKFAEDCVLLMDEPKGFIFLPLKLRETMNTKMCFKIEWDGDSVVATKKKARNDWVNQLQELLSGASEADMCVNVLEAKKDTLVLPGIYLLYWKIRLDDVMEPYVCVKLSEMSFKNWQSALGQLYYLAPKFADDESELKKVW